MVVAKRFAKVAIIQAEVGGEGWVTVANEPPRSFKFHIKIGRMHAYCMRARSPDNVSSRARFVQLSSCKHLIVAEQTRRYSSGKGVTDCRYGEAVHARSGQAHGQGKSFRGIQRETLGGVQEIKLGSGGGGGGAMSPLSSSGIRDRAQEDFENNHNFDEITLCIVTCGSGVQPRPR